MITKENMYDNIENASNVKFVNGIFWYKQLDGTGWAGFNASENKIDFITEEEFQEMEKREA